MKTLEESIHENGQAKLELDAKLRDYEFPARARGVFLRLGIETVRDLIQKTPDDFLALKNCGMKTVFDIQGFLAFRAKVLTGRL